MSADEILKALQLRFNPGEVIEIWFKFETDDKYPNKTRVGYYEYKNFEQASKDIYKLRDVKEIKAIYTSVNPVKPEMLAIANNRILNNAPTRITEDQVIKRTGLFLDADPVRKSGSSSNDCLLYTSPSPRDRS